MKTLHSLLATLTLLSASCATNTTNSNPNAEVTKADIQNASRPCKDWAARFMFSHMVMKDVKRATAHANLKSPICKNETLKKKLIAKAHKQDRIRAALAETE